MFNSADKKQINEVIDLLRDRAQLCVNVARNSLMMTVQDAATEEANRALETIQLLTRLSRSTLPFNAAKYAQNNND